MRWLRLLTIVFLFSTVLVGPRTVQACPA